MKTGWHNRGFTLTELMLTLAVAAVLMGVAAPSMQGAIQNASISARHNTLISAIQLARSEAVKRGLSISVCARATDATCGNATDWRSGWLVFTDQGANPGAIDTDEEVLAIYGAIPDALQLKNMAKVAGGAGATSARRFVRFNPRGGSNWRGGGTFMLCDERGNKSIRAINIVLSGDIRKARKDSSGNTIDAFGNSLSCPTS